MTTGYRLATVHTNGQLRAAVIVGDTMFDAPTVLKLSQSRADGDIVTMNDVLEEWPRCEPAFAAFAEADPSVRADVEGRALDVNDLVAPLMPGTIFCAGPNYIDHAQCRRRRRDAPCGGIHHRGRSVGSRPFRPQGRARNFAVLLRLDQPEMLRWRDADRAVDHTGRVCGRPIGHAQCAVGTSRAP